MMFYLSIYQDFSSSNTKFFKKKKVKEGGGILLGKHAVQVSEPCHMSVNNHCRFPPYCDQKESNVNDLVNLSRNDRETESIPDKYLIRTESYRNSLIITQKNTTITLTLGYFNAYLLNESCQFFFGNAWSPEEGSINQIMAFSHLINSNSPWVLTLNPLILKTFFPTPRRDHQTKLHAIQYS